MSAKGTFLERFFELSAHGTDVKTEVIAGVTTFLTMGYIIAVNPMNLSAAGMDKGALVTATCLAASLSCILMGLYANLPLALASGMGLNAFFAYSVCIGMKIHWRVALAAVFVEGLIFYCPYLDQCTIEGGQCHSIGSKGCRVSRYRVFHCVHWDEQCQIGRCPPADTRNFGTLH